MRSHFDFAHTSTSLSVSQTVLRLRSGLYKVFDEVFVDAGEEGEFFDGDEFVFGFAQGGTDLLQELACCAATTACDVFDITCVKDDTSRY